MENSLWQLVDVSLGSRRTLRLRDISVRIAPGVTAVIGQSGAGKTSLLNVLAGYEKPTRGRLVHNIKTEGFSLPRFWAPYTDGLWPHLTVIQHLKAVSPRRQDAQNAMHLLEAFDLVNQQDDYPGTLSQGERARLNVARCLAADAAVCIMDEPFVHVDAMRLAKYWQVLLTHVHECGCSLIFSTHQPEMVLLHAQRVVCLDHGTMLYNGDVRNLYDDPGDQQQAAQLGPFNWFEPEEILPWFGHERDRALCVRPERLAVKVADDGPCVIEAARFGGCVGELDILHQSTGIRRTVIHRPSGANYPVGSRVSLKVL